jgi:hypothetical protein
MMMKREIVRAPNALDLVRVMGVVDGDLLLGRDTLIM